MDGHAAPVAIFIPCPPRPGQPGWRDAMELAHVAAADPRELVFVLDLPAGHFQGVIRTRRGQFPMETLYLHLHEWPSLRRVPCGPFDFDHTDNTMTVPCFHVQVDAAPPEVLATAASRVAWACERF